MGTTQRTHRDRGREGAGPSQSSRPFIPTPALPVSLAGSNLNDGLWHSVSVNARRNRITLTLDNDAASPAQDTSQIQIYSGNSYYFGGKLLSFEAENKGKRENVVGNYFALMILLLSIRPYFQHTHIHTHSLTQVPPPQTYIEAQTPTPKPKITGSKPSHSCADINYLGQC